MGDAHGGLGLVDVLATGTGSAVNIDAQVFGADLHVHFLGFGHHGHGGGGSMDAALGLGGGHALHAVGTGLELEVAVHAVTGDEADDFLVAAAVGRGFAHDLHLPALDFGITGVHAEEVGGEQGRFLTAGTGADFKDGVLFVQRVLGQQQHLDLVLQLGQFGFGGGDLFLRHGLDVRIAVVQELLVLFQFLREAAMTAEQFHHVAQVRMRLGQLAVLILVVVDVRLGKRLFKLHILFFKTFQLGKHANSRNVWPRRSD